MVIGLLRFIIIFLGIIIIYYLVIHQDPYSGTGRDPGGRDVEVSQKEILHYYPGVIGLYRITRMGSSPDGPQSSQ